MGTFLKVQATSVMASGIDFITTILCVHFWYFGYVAASLNGAVSGGIVSFIVSKKWAFAESRQPVASQVSRFIIVWLGSAGANAVGLFVATHFMDVQYLVAKTAVGFLVGISFNYFLQKDFVFTMS